MVYLPEGRGMNHTPVAIWSRPAGDDVEGLEASSANPEAHENIEAMRPGEATASVSLLPAEILTQIFSHIHPTSPAHAGSVMLACRYWNAVLLRTSVFWADLVESPWTLNDISIRVYPERFAAFRFAVAHSGTLPLDLGFVGMGEALSSFLTCHPSRVCSITLSVVLPKELMSLHTLLGGEMPNLGSLVIKQHRGPEYRTQIPRIQYPSLHEACLPHLHTLHLSGRHFALKAPLRSVRHLTLTRCSWTACGCDAFQFDSLIDVLGHFPDLETLTIDSSVPASGIATHRVRLKALRKLSIHDYSVSIADLLAQLDIPRDTMLDLRIPDDDNELYSQALPLQVRSTLLGVCAAETVHVRVRESIPAMRVRTRIGGALRLRLVSSSVNFVLEGLLSHLGAMFTPVTTLTTLVLDVWCDNLVLLSSLHDLLYMSALTTVGILGPDGRRALLPFMGSTEGKRALRSLKHLYLTWDPTRDNDFPSHMPTSSGNSSNHPNCTYEDTSDPDPSGGGGARLRDRGEDAQEACNAFCDVVAPVLVMDPYANALESLHVLIVKHDPPPNGVVWDVDLVQEQLSGQLGHLAQLSVSWYVPEEDSESTLLDV